MTEKRAYRTGSVYQRKSDGRWIGSIPDGHGGRARYVTGTDRADVMKRLEKARSSTTSPRGRSTETVASYLGRWLDGEVRRGRLRPRTASGYETLLRLHILPAIGRVRMDALTAGDIDHLVSGVLDHRSPQTARHVYKVIHRALGQAVRLDLLDKNPADRVEAPRVKAPTPSPLSVADARRFLSAAGDEPWFALYALAITTGMRRGELLALKWSDIDMEAGTVRVEKSLRQVDRYRFVREAPKTERSRRVLTIPAIALRALRSMPRTTTGYVFARADGRPLPPAEVTRGFQACLERHGFRRVRFHDLRHTAANLALDRMGGDIRAVSAMLGHASITTTVAIYGTAADDARRRAAKAMDDIFEGVG